MAKKQVPELRFKGFEGEWEEKELGEVASFAKGYGYSKNDLLNAGDPIVLYGRLYTNYQTVITNVDTYTLKKKGSIFSSGNEVIVPASGETPEDIARASAVKQPNTILGGDLNIIYPNNAINPIFLALNISNGYTKNELSRKAQGKTIVHLHNSDLADLSLSFPKNIEQTKIGAFFQNLDSLIALRQRKHDKLLTVKKGMMEKMFPKEGADVPELRFKGFTGKWENRTFGELMEISSAARVHKAEWRNEGVPFFRSSDVVSAFRNEENTKAYISHELYRELSALSGCLQLNDILVTGGGSIGIPYLVKSNEPLYFKDADLLWFKNSSEIYSAFLYYFLSTSVFTTYIKTITHIGTISHYTIEQAKSTPIQLPHKNEQSKIADFFQRLDSLISLHARELDKLKNIKKACLEKMFV